MEIRKKEERSIMARIAGMCMLIVCVRCEIHMHLDIKINGVQQERITGKVSHVRYPQCLDRIKNACEKRRKYGYAGESLNKTEDTKCFIVFRRIENTDSKESTDSVDNTDSAQNADSEESTDTASDLIFGYACLLVTSSPVIAAREGTEVFFMVILDIHLELEPEFRSDIYGEVLSGYDTLSKLKDISAEPIRTPHIELAVSFARDDSRKHAVPQQTSTL